ncbi:hypothetical protein TthAA37_24790 (plasmid) [Thermus thermophilus]|uniref:hypothetical protein n=1 Tax=Thermus thermophilus TaxID=274 RepID=UPI001C74BE23|nr:hypothetical protein [Thermus thermophilus]BCZ93290.1 hypothetical protein TthAA37_24790 [Thermus thermophilus]
MTPSPPLSRVPIRFGAHYAAVVVVEGQVFVKESQAPNGQVYTFYRLRLPDGSFLRLPRAHRGRPMAELLGAHIRGTFWPRTNGQGLLEKSLRLGRIGAPKGDAKGHPFMAAQGRVAFVDREEGRFGLEVRPNPGGRLKEPFTLTLWAPLSLLEDLPPVGSGVYVEGEARLKTRRLVAKKVEPARLWDDPS